MKAQLVTLSLAVVIATLTPLPAFSGTIDLEVSVTVNKRELEVELEVLVINHGDDTAYRVQPSADIRSLPFEFDSAAIGPGKRHRFRSRQQVPGIADMKPGEYPVPVMLTYRDGEGEPFHAPAYGILRTADSESAPALNLQADPVHLDDRATVTFRLLAPSLPTESVLTVTPHTAPGVVATPRTAEVSLSGNREAAIRFELHNASGAEGVSVPLIFFAETDLDNAHFTQVHEVSLSISTSSSRVDSVEGNRYTTTVFWVVASATVVFALISTGWVVVSCRTRHQTGRQAS